MARSPMWKVYSGKDYRASCKHVEDAACLVAFLGDGATIRAGHTLIVWREGQESQAASESYDHVASVVHQRLEQNRQRVRASHSNTQTLGELRASGSVLEPGLANRVRRGRVVMNVDLRRVDGAGVVADALRGKKS